MPDVSTSPFLTPVELVDRWRKQISESTLANWRCAGQGPAFAKIGGRILYAMSDIEAWESARKIGKALVAFIASAILAFAMADICDAAELDTVPPWIMCGIAGAESSSYWDRKGVFVYVDRREGRDGEVGPFQMTPIAFRTIARDGDDFARMRTDVDFAAMMSARYLCWLRARSDSWESAVRAYNVGLHGSKDTGDKYLKRVKERAKNNAEVSSAIANPR